MSFVGLNKFLEKFKSLAPPEIAVRKAFVGVVKKTLGINIDVTQVSYDKNRATVYLKTKGVNKSVFFINKEELLKTLNKELGRESIESLVLS